MPIKRRKISELEEAKDLTGFFTIGYRVLNGVKKSVKYGLEHIQTAYENMLKAMDEAKEATTDMRLLEATVQENEEDRETAESRRDASEQGRCNEEEKRVEAENIRKIAESKRVDAESGRVTEEDARHNSELVRINAESLRVTEENTRKTAETGRVNAENNRVTEEGKRATAEKGRVDAEAGRVSEFATLKQNAETATANANDTANHPTYIGSDHYVYKWNKSTKAYDKMDIYCKGDAFGIKIVYPSVAALQADVNNTDVRVGDFALVNTGNVEDPDNAKLYVKNKKADGTYIYDFLVDMSGAIGFTGKTPQFSIGTVSKGAAPSVSLSEDGTDTDGNPKYKLNLVLPQGEKGEAPVLEVGTITTGASGSQVSVSLEPNGSTSTGAPKYRLNMTIPQGPQGAGNMQVPVSELVSGKTYLFKPSVNNSAVGTLVEFSQAQADWDVTDTNLPSFIKNKPSSFTPSAHKHKKSEITDFPTSMPASDVYDWAKQQNKPSYSASEVGALPSGGTAVAATKLATYRTIWGQSFDGTKNITGEFNSNSNVLTSAQFITTGKEDSYSGFFVSGHEGRAWGEGVGAYNVTVENNANQTSLLLAYRSGTDFNVGANRLFEMDLLNSGTELKMFFGGGDNERFNFRNTGELVAKKFSGEINLNNCYDADVLEVAPGTITRKVLLAKVKTGQGFISRAAIGLENSPNTFAPVLLSVGIDDNGRDWRNYAFDRWGNVTINGDYVQNQSGVGLYNSTTNARFKAVNGPYWESNQTIIVYGNVQASAGFFKQSDIRLKSDVTPLTHTLDQILSIPTSSFMMDDKEQIGSIAQDVEKICPEIVLETFKRKNEVPERDDWEVEIKEEDGKNVEYVKVKQVEYEMLGVLALEGLKLLNQKVDNLRNELLNR